MYALFGHLATEKERENDSSSAHPFILYFPLYQSAAIFIRRTDRLFGSLPAILSVCLAAIISTIIVKSTFMQNVCTLHINCL